MTLLTAKDVEQRAERTEEAVCAAGICGGVELAGRTGQGVRQGFDVEAGGDAFGYLEVADLEQSRSGAVAWIHGQSRRAVQEKFHNFFSVWPEARQKVPYALMQEMRITPELAGYQELLQELFFELIDGKLETEEQIRAFLEPYSPPAPPPPVNIRRTRGKKTSEAKARAKAEEAEEADEEELEEMPEGLKLKLDDDEVDDEEEDEDEDLDEDAEPAPKKGKAKPEPR